MEGEYGEEGREEKGGGRTGRGGAGCNKNEERQLHYDRPSPSLCDLLPGGVTFTV